MRIGSVVGVWTVLAYRWTQAVVTVSMDGEFKACDNGMELIGLDLSQFDVLELDDENITLNGRLTATRDYNSPMSVRLYAKRLVSGNWVASVDRFIPNFCDVITSPNEMWTPFTSALERQSCPYLEGHTEHFDHRNIGNGVKNMNIPPSMLGQWQFFLEVGTVRNLIGKQECAMVDLLVEEV